jgi:hypothetical protein
VTPEVAEASPAEDSPGERLDCDLAAAGIAVKTAATANARNIIRQIVVLARLLSDWPTRHPCTPTRPANEKCDSELHLDDRIVSPWFEIGSASPMSRHAMRSERTATPHGHTHSDIFRMKSSSDAHICSESQDVFVRVPSATPDYRPFSPFQEMSKTDQTPTLNPGHDGQRFIAFAAVFMWLLLWRCFHGTDCPVLCSLLRKPQESIRGLHRRTLLFGA